MWARARGSVLGSTEGDVYPRDLRVSGASGSYARAYWADPARTVKTNDRTGPGDGGAVEDNPSVLEDWEKNLNVEEYKVERKIYNEQVLAVGQ